MSIVQREITALDQAVVGRINYFRKGQGSFHGAIVARYCSCKAAGIKKALSNGIIKPSVEGETSSKINVPSRYNSLLTRNFKIFQEIVSETPFGV